MQESTSKGKTHFTFAYLKQAESLERFRPFAGFPELHRTYESDRLFSLFSNRVMPRDRPDFGRYVERLDLHAEPEPFEILARSGGRKATDRVEVFPAPEPDPVTGRLHCMFFARGIRHIEGASENVIRLQPGDDLQLIPDRENPVNPQALLLRSNWGGTLGYVPDYLVNFLNDMVGLCHGDLGIAVEHVNPPDTPGHLRLLCRVETCVLERYEPFSEPSFRPLVDLDATS